MKPEASILCSQEPATGPYPQPDESSPQSKTLFKIVRFQFLTAVSMKMAVLWVVEQCSLVEVYRRFRGVYCLHHQSIE
jgi:hypothetical protein